MSKKPATELLHAQIAIIPGQLLPAAGFIEINQGREVTTVEVTNTGDRPIQVGSHYHFAETNSALSFDRKAVKGMRLNIGSGTAVRFEPGQARTIELIAYVGKREVYGFNQAVMGRLAPGNLAPGKRASVRTADKSADKAAAKNAKGKK